jgi:predicted DNA-binding protein
MTESEPKAVFTTIRLPLETRDRLRAKAEANHRTMSQEIRRLIDEALADEPNGNEVAA